LVGLGGGRYGCGHDIGQRRGLQVVRPRPRPACGWKQVPQAALCGPDRELIDAGGWKNEGRRTRASCTAVEPVRAGWDVLSMKSERSAWYFLALSENGVKRYATCIVEGFVVKFKSRRRRGRGTKWKDKIVDAPARGGIRKCGKHWDADAHRHRSRGKEPRRPRMSDSSLGGLRPRRGRRGLHILRRQKEESYRR